MKLTSMTLKVSCPTEQGAAAAGKAGRALFVEGWVRFWGLGFWALGFWGLGFRVLGFRGLEFRVLGFRV